MLTETPVSRAARGGLDASVPIAALTFDDGPNGADTLRLLDHLRERRIRAVFAVIGENILAPGGGDLPSGAEVLRRIVADGHVLCNHGMSDTDMGEWDALTVRDDLLKVLDVIEQAAGDAVPVPYWRAPRGSWGVTAPVATRLGMQPLAVTGTIGDWEEQDPAVLASRLRVAMEPGAVVLAHDGGGDRAGTIDAVIEVVDERLADGWRFVLPEMP
ncbi:polysaccharide deacetylase family protein [Demequina lignilytica]|uniref:Polysaccharide deacetylase family protein n=1 Tax=Demequina lignilytica TaxID=3051663 RepID=A0AAW7M9W3_9MICO|nr:MULTISPECIES: polysaccharide deacetylase family protein [unclassified Demequina]MDN4478832.1 polysaccharide deacetylase family protein [Demequina sp. SYSU T00039-1]MDN4484069.1 polysaccharide deacetylase family protein [Demequina sp. SYSU T0a273]MDN4488930.1 polysaccharide deacetylase family protein [Demequina sp. SYSU T00039]MDN4490348.1 polysaccharide deacetylase family protein [Demequina sp. SYSU T00068]